jgi:hypothetical protein
MIRPSEQDLQVKLTRSVAGEHEFVAYMRLGRLAFRSLRPTDFVLRVQLHLFEVPRFPVGEVGFHNHVRRLQRPAQLSLVREAHAHVQHPFLEDVLGPVHDLAVDAGILLPRPG